MNSRDKLIIEEEMNCSYRHYIARKHMGKRRRIGTAPQDTNPKIEPSPKRRKEDDVIARATSKTDSKGVDTEKKQGGGEEAEVEPMDTSNTEEREGGGESSNEVEREGDADKKTIHPLFGTWWHELQVCGTI